MRLSKLYYLKKNTKLIITVTAPNISPKIEITVLTVIDVLDFFFLRKSAIPIIPKIMADNENTMIAV